MSSNNQPLTNLTQLLRSTKTEVLKKKETLHVQIKDPQKYDNFIGLQELITFNANGEYVGRPFSLSIIPGFYEEEASRALDRMRGPLEDSYERGGVNPLQSNLLVFNNNGLQDGLTSNLFFLSRDDQEETHVEDDNGLLLRNALEFGVQRGRLKIDEVQNGNLTRDVTAYEVEPIFNVRRQRVEMREGLQLFMSPEPPVSSWDNARKATSGLQNEGQTTAYLPRLLPESKVDFRIHDPLLPLEVTVADVSAHTLLLYGHGPVRELVQNVDCRTTGEISTFGVHYDVFPTTDLPSVPRESSGFRLDRRGLGLYYQTDLVQDATDKANSSSVRFYRDILARQGTQGHRSRPVDGTQIGGLEFYGHRLHDGAEGPDTRIDASSYELFASLTTDYTEQGSLVSLTARMAPESGFAETVNPVWALEEEDGPTPGLRRSFFHVHPRALFERDVEIRGGLNVYGQVTSIESRNIVIEDPVITLGRQKVPEGESLHADGADRGLLLEYAVSQDQLRRAFLGYLPGRGTFAALRETSWQDASYSRVDLSGAYVRGDLLAGALDVSAALVRNDLVVGAETGAGAAGAGLTVRSPAFSSLLGGLTDGTLTARDGLLRDVSALVVRGSALDLPHKTSLEVHAGDVLVKDGLEVRGRSVLDAVHVRDVSHTHLTAPVSLEAGGLRGLRELLVGRETPVDPWPVAVDQPSIFRNFLHVDASETVPPGREVLPSGTAGVIDLLVRTVEVEGVPYEVFDVSGQGLGDDPDASFLLYAGTYRFRNLAGRPVAFLSQAYHGDSVEQTLVSGSVVQAPLSDFTAGLMEAAPRTLYSSEAYPLEDLEVGISATYSFFEDNAVFDLTVRRDFGLLSLASNSGTELTVDGQTYGQGVFLGRYRAFSYSSLASGRRPVDVAASSVFRRNVLLEDALEVRGDALLSSSLTVSGAVLFRDQLRVARDTILDGLATANADVAVNASLGVTGAVDFGGAAVLRSETTVQDSLFVDASLSVLGNSFLQGVTTVGGPTVLQQTLQVTGASTFQDALTGNGAAAFASRLDVAGDVSLAQELQVQGQVDLQSGLAVGGASSFVGDMDLRGALHAAAAATVSGDVVLGRDLDVLRLASAERVLVRDTLEVSGTALFRTDVGLAGNLLDVSGSARVHGGLRVEGRTDLHGEVLSSAPLTVTDDVSLARLTVVGPGRFHAGLSVGEEAHFEDRILVDGSLVALKAVDVSGVLRVRGPAALEDRVTCVAPVTLDASLQVAGSVDVASRLDVRGALRIAEDVSALGVLHVPSAESRLRTTVLEALPGSTYALRTANLRNSSSSSEGNAAHRGVLVEAGSPDLAGNGDIYFVDCCANGIGVVGGIKYASQGFGLYSTSDGRRKTDIRFWPEEDDDGDESVLRGIEQVPVRSFLWKTSSCATRNVPYQTDPMMQRQIGFVAQEVEQVFPELVDRSSDPRDTLHVHTTGMIPFLWRAVQDLYREVKTLRQSVSLRDKLLNEYFFNNS